jgi:two-component system sensor histidine kinase/response regulator
LVVEDDDELRSLIELQLEESGVASVGAPNGAVALETLAKQPFALVLLDVHMPVLDGHATLRLLRRNPRHAHLPVVALTGRVGPKERDELMRLGADECLGKPIEADELRRLLRRYGVLAAGAL